MSNDNDTSTNRQPEQSTLDPAKRARLQTCFEYGNKKMQSGDHDYATEMFVQCVTGDPGNLIYMQTYIGNLRVKYGNNKKGASFGFLKGGGARSAVKMAETRKKWADVLKSGCAALKTNPWDDSIFFAMGKACLELGYNETGLAYLKHAIECNPDDIELNRFAATELGAQGILDQAIACWQRILNKKPDDMQAKRNIADLLIEKTIKKVQENPTGGKIVHTIVEVDDDTETKYTPEEKLEKKLAKNPESRPVYEEMYEYFFQRGLLKKAEDICNRALKVFENDEVFTSRIVELRLQRVREELEQIKNLYAKNPSDQLRERFNKLKEEFEQKKLAFIKLRLEKNPQNGQLHYEYGTFLMRHSQYKEAINEFQTAKVDATIRGECMLSLAFCFQQIKQYKLAMMHYENALAELLGEGENVKQALYQGARLAFYLDDIQKADDYAHRLAAIDFSYKDLGDLLDKIEKKSNNK